MRRVDIFVVQPKNTIPPKKKRPKWSDWFWTILYANLAFGTWDSEVPWVAAFFGFLTLCGLHSIFSDD